MRNDTYRWVLVAAGGLLGCMAIGSMFTLPVFILPIARETGWSVTGISTAMTIAFLAMAIGSMALGSLSDRIGARPVVLMGSVVLAASIYWASRATSLIEFQLIFGLALHHEGGFLLSGPNTRFFGLDIPQLSGAGHVDYTIPSLPLLGGRDLLSAAVYDDSMLHPYDHHDRLYRLTVQSDQGHERFGVLALESEPVDPRL